MSTTATAVELGRADGYDPWALSTRIKSVSNAPRGVRRFYESQNETIHNLLKPVDQHYADSYERASSSAMPLRIAVRGSLVINCLLACLQVYGAVSSLSLSLFATMADSVFDPLSNLFLFFMHKQSAKLDSRRFPSGKVRLETVGNITFSVFMCMISVILITVSSVRLATNDGQDESPLHWPSIIAVGIALVAKFVMFLYCFSLRNQYSQVRMLWQDHRNDCFANAFGLTTSVLGSKIDYRIDPAGAMVLSSIIIILWCRTVYHEFQLLIGITAPPTFIQLITYISLSHSPLIKAIDTVYAYHSGPRIIVEVDIVVDENMTVKQSHNLAEELQMKIESLPDVERGYVHVDYDSNHIPEHNSKKDR